MADYPDKKLSQENKPSTAGHSGVVIDSGVEGVAKYSGSDSIKSNSRGQGKKSAGMVGASNINAA